MKISDYNETSIDIEDEENHFTNMFKCVIEIAHGNNGKHGEEPKYPRNETLCQGKRNSPKNHTAGRTFRPWE